MRYNWDLERAASRSNTEELFEKLFYFKTIKNLESKPGNKNIKLILGFHHSDVRVERECEVRGQEDRSRAIAGYFRNTEYKKTSDVIPSSLYDALTFGIDFFIPKNRVYIIKELKYDEAGDPYVSSVLSDPEPLILKEEIQKVASKIVGLIEFIEESGFQLPLL